MADILLYSNRVRDVLRHFSTYCYYQFKKRELIRTLTQTWLEWPKYVSKICLILKSKTNKYDKNNNNTYWRLLIPCAINRKKNLNVCNVSEDATLDYVASTQVPSNRQNKDPTDRNSGEHFHTLFHPWKPLSNNIYWFGRRIGPIWHPITFSLQL